MHKTLRVLFVEDSEDDMLLTLRELKKGWDNVTFERVETEQTMTAALDKQKWDIVISDYSMPHFSGIDALKLFNKSGLDIPFILVSGKISEEKAIEAMKAGAHDFVMKGNLARLLPAIERELHDAEAREKKKKAEEALRIANERYRLITENMSDIIGITDMNMRATFLTPSIERALGYTIDELNSIPMEKQVTPDSFKVLSQTIAEELTEKNIENKDMRISQTLYLEFYHKDGSTLWGEIKVDLIRDPQGKPTGFVVTGRDVTDRKKADAQIKASLKEKEVLLREIHHRVKNNLQIISSLLDMVNTRTSDKEAIDLFTNVNTKIYAMSAIHSQLYERKQFDGVDMEEYIKKLVDRIFSVYPEKRGQIALMLDMPKIVLSLDQAVPCGLVLNELISNSLKHAFKKEGQGIIEVSIKRVENTVFLRVKDNGTGIQGVDIYKTESLGIKLVRTLVLDQLEGDLKVNHGDGTEFLIEFTTSEETLIHEKTV
jgi:PAS domain S-box-containing protein